MKTKFTFLVLLALLFGVSSSYAAYTAPEAGKVFRIHNCNYPGKVMAEDYIQGTVIGVNYSSNTLNMEQLWVLVEDGTGYYLENAATGRYAQHQTQTSATFLTATQPQTFYITKVNGEDSYNIINRMGDGQGMHLDAASNVVRWSTSATATKWQFEEVEVSADAIELKRLEFQNYLDLKNNAATYTTALETFFTDASCTELLPTYAAMSDEDLRQSMSELPVSLQDMALKIKNKTWGKREEEFRIRNYKAYSDPDYWYEKLYTKKYSRLNNPTGIYGNSGDVLLVFVGDDVPEGATLSIEAITGTSVQGTKTGLKKGLNVVATARDQSMMFIQYVGTTTMEGETLITDYPELKIHIEQGTVNGFWNIHEHTNDDWVDMIHNLATSEAFQVVGERIMFHMSLSRLKEFCPNTITDAIGWWDEMSRWQQDLIGIEEYRPSKFNNLGCAISLPTGYQSATHYRTQYLDSYLTNLLPYNKMMSHADNCWGPGHENGHVHQAAIQSVGTAEVSNNLFSNLTLNKLGKYLSRGDYLDVVFDDYAADKPYILRGGGVTLRSFWQLYLYFHEAKVDTTFYPRVFQAMRATPMAARDPERYANSVYGNEDLLLFAKACCDVAQLDLSEFFRFWGYLSLTDNQYIDDYAAYYLTNRQSDVDEFLAHASQYPKAPSIVFIEDRVKQVPRTDGGEGYKLTYSGKALNLGEAGDVGHYTDFMDTSIKAEGYLYNKVGSKISITEGTGAIGFKVYDKSDSTLLFGSNRLNFNLPSELATRNVYVVAAQADGTDVVLQTVALGGTEEQQYEALKDGIRQAKEMIAMSDENGSKPGFYFGESVDALQTYLVEATMAYDNKDQSVRTYGEWAMLLDEEMVRVAADPYSRQAIYEANWYSLTNVQYPNYSIATSGTKLRCTMADPASNEAKQWSFVPAASENSYYICNRSTGKYISTIGQSQQVTATASTTADALAFTLIDNGDGTFAFKEPSQNYGAIHCDAGKAVVGWEASATASTWRLECLVDGQSELFEQQFEGLIARAEEILTELVVGYEENPNVEEVTIMSDVTPLIEAASLQAMTEELHATVMWYNTSGDVVITNYMKHIHAMTTLIDQLVASYSKPLYLPQTSTDETLVLYRILDMETGLYCYEEKENARYKGYVHTKEYELDDTDESLLWYFMPGDTDSTVYICNYATRQGAYVVSGRSYVSVLADDVDATVFTLSADQQQGGFVISTADEKDLYISSMGYVQTSKTRSALWKFVKAGSAASVKPEAVVPDDAILYDLQGRPVSSPTEGVYIRGGKKVVFTAR